MTPNNLFPQLCRFQAILATDGEDVWVFQTLGNQSFTTLQLCILVIRLTSPLPAPGWSQSPRASTSFPTYTIDNNGIWQCMQSVTIYWEHEDRQMQLL